MAQKTECRPGTRNAYSSRLACRTRKGICMHTKMKPQIILKKAAGLLKKRTQTQNCTGSAKIRQGTALLCAVAIFFTSVLHVLSPGLVLAAGTGGIKGSNLPAGYVTESQMELANAWPDMNESALYNVMRKAQNRQRVTIAFIGGSITKGTMSFGSRDRSLRKKLTYVDFCRDWWSKKFPKADLRLINAGIGATDSYLGVHRVQQDVLDKKPDLVIVEFAVNDSKTAEHKQAYENLVRKILDSETKPAVLLLFMSKMNGQSCQLQQAQIGMHYNLPMLSYGNVINDMVSKGIYTMDELSGDGIHPSALGYAVAGEILVRYFDQINEKSMGQVIRKKPSAKYVTAKKYNNAKLLSCKDITIRKMGTFEEYTQNSTFPDSLTSKKGNGDLTFTVNCKNIGLLFSAQLKGGGKFDVYVDGKKAATINADNSAGRKSKPEAVACYSSKTKKNHTVRIVRNKKSFGKQLTIYGILISD